MTALDHLRRRPHPATPRARIGAPAPPGGRDVDAPAPTPAPRLASTEENRLGQEILLLRLTGAILPVTLLAWLLGTARDPGLALGSQLIIPVYVALAGGAAWRRRRLLANPWFRALLFALQIMLVGLQVGAYDGAGTPIWLAFAPVLLVGALRWQLPGALIALGLFAADRLATVATLSHITGARAAHELILELSVMALVGVSFGAVLRELERSRRHLWRSLSRLATSTGVLSAVLDNVGEAILTVDDAGLVSSANGAAGDLFASESGRLVGGPLEGLIDAPGLGIDDLMRGGSRSRRHEATGRRPDGSGFTAEVMATLLLGDGGTTRILVVRDVSELRARTAALSYEARHDGLTGLPNRVLFLERLATSIEVAARRSIHSAVLFIDIDRFKSVNDIAGHAATFSSRPPRSGCGIGCGSRTWSRAWAGTSSPCSRGPRPRRPPRSASRRRWSTPCASPSWWRGTTSRSVRALGSPCSRSTARTRRSCSAWPMPPCTRRSGARGGGALPRRRPPAGAAPPPQGAPISVLGPVAAGRVRAGSPPRPRPRRTDGAQRGRTSSPSRLRGASRPAAR